MARIPLESPTQSMNVPSVGGPNPESFGAASEALARVGAQVADTGLQLLEQVKVSEAKDAAGQAYFQDKLDSEQKLQELKLQSPDGYVRMNPEDPSSPYATNSDGTRITATQAYHEWADGRFRSRQKDMPSALAQGFYKDRAMEYFTGSTAQFASEVQVMKVKAFNQNFEQTTLKLADRLTSNPSLEQFYSHTNDLSMSIADQIGKGRLYSPTEAKSKISTTEQFMADKLMNGAYVRVLAKRRVGDKRAAGEVYEWMGVLRGEDRASQIRKSQGLPTISEMMNPDQKAEHMTKLTNILETAKSLDRSDYSYRFEESIAAQKRGEGSPVAFNSLKNETLAYMKSGEMTAGEASYRFGELYTAKYVGRLQGPSFDMLPPAKQAQLITEAIGRAKNEAQETAKLGGIVITADMGARASEAIETAGFGVLKSNTSQVEQDWAQFAGERLGSGQVAMKLDHATPASLGNGRAPQILQDAVRQSKAAFNTKVANRPELFRPITKTQSEQYSVYLQDPNISEEQAISAVRGLQKGYGKYFGEVMNQMVKDQKLGEQWLIATLSPKQTSSMLVISSLRGNKQTDALFKENIESNKLTAFDVSSSVAKYTEEYIGSTLRDNPYSLNQKSFALSVNRAVENAAKQIYLQGGGKSASEFEKAAKDAYDAIIGQYTLKGDPNNDKWFSSGLKKAPVLPTQLGNITLNKQDSELIYSNLKGQINTVEGLAKFSIVVPTKADGSKSDFHDKFFPMVANTAYPTNSEQGGVKGFSIWYNDGSAIDKQVFIKNHQGEAEPLFIPTETLLKPPTPPAPKPKAPAKHKFVPGRARDY